MPLIHAWIFDFDMQLGIDGYKKIVDYLFISIRVPGVIIHSSNYLFVFNSQIIAQILKIAKKVKMA
jgi:hypothetical protein